MKRITVYNGDEKIIVWEDQRDIMAVRGWHEEAPKVEVVEVVEVIEEFIDEDEV